jgi:hypothetical protein
MMNRGPGGGSGQYVVVESTTNAGQVKGKRRTFRGKLDAQWGESVEIHNTTGGPIRLFFPEPKIFRETTTAEITVSNGDKFSRTFANLDLEGRYEYAVLYKRTLLRKPQTDYVDDAEWGFAIGGSSSEFIIRRPSGIG